MQEAAAVLEDGSGSPVPSSLPAAGEMRCFFCSAISPLPTVSSGVCNPSPGESKPAVIWARVSNGFLEEKQGAELGHTPVWIRLAFFLRRIPCGPERSNLFSQASASTALPKLGVSNSLQNVSNCAPGTPSLALGHKRGKLNRRGKKNDPGRRK